MRTVVAGVCMDLGSSRLGLSFVLWYTLASRTRDTALRCWLPSAYPQAQPSGFSLIAFHHLPFALAFVFLLSYHFKKHELLFKVTKINFTGKKIITVFIIRSSSWREESFEPLTLAKNAVNLSPLFALLPFQTGMPFPWLTGIFLEIQKTLRSNPAQTLKLYKVSLDSTITLHALHWVLTSHSLTDLTL